MSKSIMVWDPLIRGGHWIIVTAFALAYFTEEDLLSVHVWAGYVVGVAVVIHTLWGFVGPNRAHFPILSILLAQSLHILMISFVCALCGMLVTVPPGERWL